MLIWKHGHYKKLCMFCTFQYSDLRNTIVPCWFYIDKSDQLHLFSLPLAILLEV